MVAPIPLSLKNSVLIAFRLSFFQQMFADDELITQSIVVQMHENTIAHILEKLFDNLVAPVMLNCCEIWAITCGVNDSIPFKISIRNLRSAW